MVRKSDGKRTTGDIRSAWCIYAYRNPLFVLFAIVLSRFADPDSYSRRHDTRIGLGDIYAYVGYDGNI